MKTDRIFWIALLSFVSFFFFSTPIGKAAEDEQENIALQGIKGVGVIIERVSPDLVE
jgi:hypothetical protein